MNWYQIHVYMCELTYEVWELKWYKIYEAQPLKNVEGSCYTFVITILVVRYKTMAEKTRTIIP